MSSNDTPRNFLPYVLKFCPTLNFILSKVLQGHTDIEGNLTNQQRKNHSPGSKRLYRLNDQKVYVDLSIAVRIC